MLCQINFYTKPANVYHAWYCSPPWKFDTESVGSICVSCYQKFFSTRHIATECEWKPMWQTNWYHFLEEQGAKFPPREGGLYCCAENWTDLFGKLFVRPGPNYEVSFDANDTGKGCVVFGTKLMLVVVFLMAALVVPAVDARFPPSDWTNWHMWQWMCSKFSWEFSDSLWQDAWSKFKQYWSPV